MIRIVLISAAALLVAGCEHMLAQFDLDLAQQALKKAEQSGDAAQIERAQKQVESANKVLTERRYLDWDDEEGPPPWGYLDLRRLGFYFRPAETDFDGVAVDMVSGDRAFATGQGYAFNSTSDESSAGFTLGVNYLAKPFMKDSPWRLWATMDFSQYGDFSRSTDTRAPGDVLRFANNPNVFGDQAIRSIDYDAWSWGIAGTFEKPVQKDLSFSATIGLEYFSIDESSRFDLLNDGTVVNSDTASNDHSDWGLKLGAAANYRFGKGVFGYVDLKTVQGIEGGDVNSIGIGIRFDSMRAMGMTDVNPPPPPVPAPPSPP
jgi:hypothetical protein